MVFSEAACFPWSVRDYTEPPVAFSGNVAASLLSHGCALLLTLPAGRLALLQHAPDALSKLDEGPCGGNDDRADEDLSELGPALRAVDGRMVVVHHDPDGVDGHHEPGGRDADGGGVLLELDHDLVESIKCSHDFRYPF